MADQPRLLVIEGNTADSCAQTQALSGTTSGGRYRQSILNAEPDAHVDIIVAAEADAALPDGVALGDYHGVAIAGSSLHAQDADTDPRVGRQVDLARAALAEGLPMLGSCWGLQVGVVAAGGTVAANPRGREVGVARKISLTPAGRGHPMFENKASVFDSVCIHFDEVSHLPPGATVLASNGHSDVQAACFDHGAGSFWGVQYHPEFDLGHMAYIYERERDEMIESGFCVDTAAHADLLASYRSLQADADQPHLAWLLGVDDDVLDTSMREREIANWVHRAVLPRVGR